MSRLKVAQLLQAVNPHTVPTREQDLTRLELTMVNQLEEAGRLAVLLARLSANTFQGTLSTLNHSIQLSIEISQLYPDDQMRHLLARSLFLTEKHLTAVARMVDREVRINSK